MLLAVTFHPLRASSPHSHCRVAVVMNGNTVCEMSDTQCVALCFNQTFPFRDLIWFGASFLVFKSLWIYFFSIVQLCHLFNEQTSGNQIKTVMRRFFHSLSDWEHNTNRCSLLTVCFSPLQLKTTAFGRTASPMSVVRCSSKPSTTCWSAASWIAVLFASGSGSWNPTRRTRSPLIRGTWMYIYATQANYCYQKSMYGHFFWYALITFLVSLWNCRTKYDTIFKSSLI